MAFKKLTEQLYFYLIQHDFLHLPGLGDFILNRVAASIDSETRSLIAPHYTIQFTPSDRGTHRELFSFLSEKLNITEVSAIKLVNEYAMELKSMLNHDGFAFIDFIGKIYYNDYGVLNLEARPMSLNFLSQSVPDIVNVDAIKTIIPEEEENEPELEEVVINEKEEESSIWKKSAIIFISIAIFILLLSRISGNPSQLMGLQNSIQVKLPLLQHD
jgi:hypothetical protein